MTSCETKRIDLSRPIYLISLIYTVSIALPGVCQAQATTSSTSDGVSGSFEFNKSTANVVITVGSALFFTTALSYYIYRFCCYEYHGFSLPIQTSSGNGGPNLGGLGLDHETIETFPILLYSAVKNIKIGSEPMDCAICLREFEGDDTLRFIPICHHVFHPDCIDTWLSSHVTCPVCRANLAEKFERGPIETTGDNSTSESIETQAPCPIVIVNGDQNEVVSPRPKKVCGKFSRSHSTGHSLVLPGETTKRYTLRLPEEVRRQILMTNANLKRVRSMNVVLDTEGSSRKGRRSYAGDEGSSKGRRTKNLRTQRPKKWIFCATPPFARRGGGGGEGGSDGIASFGNDREGSVNGGTVGNIRFSNGKEGSPVNGKSTLLTAIKIPDFSLRRTDGAESSSSSV